MLVCAFLFVKSAQMDGFQRHFDSQLLIYGKQTVLNLVRPGLHCSSESSGAWRGAASRVCSFCFQVNQKGSEKPLEEAFAKMVAGMSSGLIKWVSASAGQMHADWEADPTSSVLSYIAFDFHKECSHMRWDRLQILVDTVAETQEEYRWQKRQPRPPLRFSGRKHWHLPLCAATSWWTLMGRNWPIKAGSFAATAWTVWTGPMLFRASWPDARCSRSFRYPQKILHHKNVLLLLLYHFLVLRLFSKFCLNRPKTGLR